MRSPATPPVVWGLVALHGALLVLLSVLYPTYRAPDETAHVDLVLAVTDHAGYPEMGTRISQRVEASIAYVRHNRVGGPEPLTAPDAPARDARPSFDEVGPPGEAEAVQQMVFHPPLYYVAAATALSVVTALVPLAYDWSFDQVVGFLRLFGALLVLPLPWLAHRVAVRLRASPPVAVTAAVLPLAVPQLTHIGASANNDTLLIALIGALTLPAVAVARGDTTTKTAVAVGVLGGLALLTKGFAVFVPLWAAAAYGLAIMRGGGRAAVSRGALAMGLMVVTGGWWWIRNLLTYRTIQPGIATAPPAETFAPDLGSWLPFYLQRLSRRFWVEPDILPDGAPPVDLFATALVLVLCLAAVVGYREVRQRPADLGLLLVPVAALGAIVTFGAWRAYARTGALLAIHGRYLYGAMVGGCVVAALGLAALARSRVRWVPVGAFAVALLAQGSAGARALTTYWGPAGLWPRVTAMLAWSPWPAPLVVLAMLAGVALAVWTGAALAGAVRSVPLGAVDSRPS